MEKPTCELCGVSHFCECGLETGHIGEVPAEKCDECRLAELPGAWVVQ